ncbi:MAG: hypothetical protein IJM02_04470 [Clostridia bacterium]|nr:hypothetical protein [Clostridia bacterium]
MGEYRIRIGTIAPEYQSNWTSTEEPFNIIDECYNDFHVSICDGMRAAGQYLHDEFQVDWGSWAWRGTKEEIEKVVSESWPNRDISLEKLESGKGKYWSMNK